MKKRFLNLPLAILGTAIFLVSIGMAHAAAPAAPAPSMVLILDASGSMWGKVEGKPKIQIAKEVITDLINAIPRNFQTGLMVYGHRQKGDCNDIEMVVPVGPQNPAAMKAKIQSISPKGMTPLSEAVRQAAVALRYTEQRATVVLVSDGLETCDKDPCAVAAELAMSGVDFTVHVIGFNISKEDQGRLRCLADRTGGLFLSADNARSLRDALFKTVEEVKAPPAPVVENPGVAEIKCPESVAAGSAFTIQWKGPNSRGDYIAIAEKAAKDLEYTDYVYTKLGSPINMTAPGKVGDYELRYIHAQSHKVIGRAPVKVTPVQATVQVPEEADVASKIEVTWQGPAYPSDYITIARPDQGSGGYLFYTYTKEGSPLKLQAPSEPGTYEVRYVLGKGNVSLAKAVIQIKGVSALVEAPPSADVASQFEVTWQGPGNKGDYISIARADDESSGYISYTYTSEGSPLKLQAPSDPGTYEVRYMLGQGDKLLAKTPIEIKGVMASVQAPPSADVASQFEVTWQGPGNKGDYISIARADDESSGYISYTYTSEGSPLKLQAPSDPGTYEVRYMLGHGDKLLAKTSIEIKGVTASVQAPPSADMASEITVTWQGPGNKGDYISIARPDQEPGGYIHYTYTRKEASLKLQSPPEPGTYEIRYILGHGNKLLAKTAIEIKKVEAKVSPPAAAAVNSDVMVPWQGPGYKSDYITISRPDQQPAAYLVYTYVKTGNPVKIKAPKEAGTYEVRYILGEGNKMLDKAAIVIK